MYCSINEIRQLFEENEVETWTLAVTVQAMTNDAVGTYHYDYTIGTDTGKYSVEVKATGATSRVTKQPHKFWVEAALS